VIELKNLGHQPKQLAVGAKDEFTHRIGTSGGSDESAAELVVEADEALGRAPRSLGTSQLNVGRSADSTASGAIL